MAILADVFTYATPAVIVLATIEGLVLTAGRKGRYDWRAYFASLGDVLVRQYVVYTYLPLSLAASSSFGSSGTARRGQGWERANPRG